jgi:hypothetical protein
LTTLNALISQTAFGYNLFLAAQKGDVYGIICMLRDKQAGIMDKDEQNATALHWASVNNHVQAAKVLLDHGAKIDEPGYTSLYI